MFVSIQTGPCSIFSADKESFYRQLRRMGKGEGCERTTHPVCAEKIRLKKTSSAEKCDLSGKLRWPKSVTAISICSRQFQFAHGNFNLLTAISICSRQFHFAHGNFNLLTAISICSRQFQFAHGNFNLLTAISVCSRQFQFAHGNFNLLTAISICLRQFQFAHGNFSLLTAISICSRQFQFAHGNFNLLISHGNWPPRGAWTRELGRGTLGKFLPRVVLEVRLRDS